MAHILYTDYSSTTVYPSELAEGFTCKEIQTAIDGYFEVIPTKDKEWILLVDEEGQLKGKRKNEQATILAGQFICGTAILCTKSEMGV